MIKKTLIIIIIFLIISTINIYSSELDVISNAEGLVESGQVSEALSLLIRAMEQYPKSYMIPNELGKIFTDQEAYNLALKYFKLSYKNGNKYFSIYKNIGRTYNRLNKNKKALKWYDKAIEVDSSDSYTNYVRIWIMIQEKMYDRAEKEVLKIYDDFKSSHYFDGVLGVLYAAIGEFDKARKYYRLSDLKSYHTSTATLYNWSILEFNLGEYEKSKELLEMALRIGMSGESNLILGEISQVKANYSIAKDYYLKGLENLNSPYPLFNLFDLYGSTGDLDNYKLYKEQLNSSNNMFWIHQYSTSVNEFKGDIADINRIYYKDMLIKNNKSTLPWYKKILDWFKYKIKYKLSSFKYSYHTLLNIEKASNEYLKLEQCSKYKEIFKNINFLYKYFLKKEIKLTSKYKPNQLDSLYLEFLEYYTEHNSLKKYEEYESLFLKHNKKNLENLIFYYKTKLEILSKRKTYNSQYYEALSFILFKNPNLLKLTKTSYPVNIINKAKSKNLYNYLKAKGFRKNKNSKISITINQISDKFSLSIAGLKGNYNLSISKDQLKNNANFEISIVKACFKSLP